MKIKKNIKIKNNQLLNNNKLFSYILIIKVY